MITSSFTGGDKLVARLAEISKKLDKGGQLRAGFLEGATYPNGTSVGMVAAIHEFGAPNAGIPPRPFFRPVIAAKSGEWGDLIADRLAAENYNVHQTLSLVGEVAQAEIQESIASVDSPALSPVTLMLRKMRSEDQTLVVTGKVVGEAARRVHEGEEIGSVNTKPLQDTGFLKSRVAYEVKT